MGRTFSVALILLLGTVVANSIVWRSRSVQAVNIKINVKDLPEHGLSIVGPADAAFDELVTSLKRKKKIPAELLKPFSVFIKNTGEKAVVAYKLRWECVKADGSIVYKDVAKSSAWVFMGEGGANLDQLLAADATIIKPRSTWFHSLVAPLQPLEGEVEDGGGWAVTGDNNAQSSEVEALLRRPSEANALKLLNAELAGYVSITVSLDGAFYEDGTFVGPDKTGFSDVVKAQVEAKSDLLQEVKTSFERGVPMNRIFESLEETAATEDVTLGVNAMASDYYRSFRRTYAKEMAAEKKVVGDIKTVEGAVQGLNKPWTKLRKK